VMNRYLGRFRHRVLQYMPHRKWLRANESRA
jgi:hypothetical protein